MGEWVRFDWDLAGLPLVAALPEGYADRLAGLRDLPMVVETVLAAYATDPVWAAQLATIRSRLEPRIAETIDRADAKYLLILRRDSIVAVSGVAREHWTGQNLLTGICVLAAHQRRGLGAALLLRSLHALRALGCNSARVYTERGSLADRKVYPLFGGMRTTDVAYPGANTRLGEVR